MSASNVATLTIDALRAADINTLFALPGVQNDDFFDALVDADDIRVIMTRHEQGASYLAMGAAQVTGKPAACCVVPGPGMLNAAAGIYSAYWGGARVLSITGQIHTALQGKMTGTLHDMPDQTAVLKQITKHVEVIHDPTTAAAQLQLAIDSVHNGVPRPVSIEIPVNVWSQAATGKLRAPTINPVPPEAEAIERAAALLSSAQRPLIVVGSGAYDASESVIELAELLQAAVTTRRQGHGVVPTAHPLFVPITVAHRLWADVDVVVGIGSRIEWPLGTWGVDDDLQLIQINIDEAEVNRHSFTTVEVVADADLACRALVDALGPLQRESRKGELDGHRAWFNQVTAHLEPQRHYTAAIRAALPTDAVLVEDVTQIGFASHLFYDHLAPRQFLTSGPAGTLGAGTAQAIGAAAATDHPVVGIVGDGGFMFTATELATAAQHNIACTILLFNDGHFGNVHRIQKNRFGPDRTIASTLQNPDFAQLAASFGVRHWRAESPADVTSTLAAAVDHDGPALVEVLVDEMPDPWPFLRMAPLRGLPD